MLEINIISQSKILETVYKGQSLKWTYQVWGRLNLESTADIFGPTNQYLATLPESTLDVLWDAYEKAHASILNIGNNDTEVELIEVLDQMASVLDYSDLLRWATTEGPIRPDPRIDETNQTSNNDEMTIVRQEAMEVVVFSLFVKLIAPIWGPYIAQHRENAGTYHKEMKASVIFTKSKFTEMPIYDRLRIYIDAYAAQRAGTSDIVLRHGITSDRLDVLLMAHLLTRRLTIYPIRGIDSPNIAAYIYKFLQGQIEQLNKNGFRDKFQYSGNGSNQEAESHADGYRIAQAISVMEETLGTIFINETVNNKNNPFDILEANMSAVKETYKNLLENKHFNTCEIHEYIVTLLFRHTISPILYRYYKERETRLLLVALASVKAEELGSPEVAALLTSIKASPDMYTMEMTVMANQSLKRMSSETDAKLALRYPYPTSADENDGTNPGKRAIEHMVSIVDTHQWLGLKEVSNLREQLANLYING